MRNKKTTKKAWEKFLADAMKEPAIDPTLPDLSNSATIARKNQEAKETLDKYGVPPQYIEVPRKGR